MSWVDVATELNGLAKLDIGRRKQLLKRINNQHWFDIALGAASDTVHEQDAKYLAYGLLALIFEGVETDMRETVSYLGLLHDAATRIGASFTQVFNRLQRYAAPSVARFIERWIKEGEKDIKMLGFRAGRSATTKRFLYQSID